ncbi:alcohol dehydrogenase [Leptospirillum ferriphilum]|uniref:Alcohol dehydrogenase n=1 Tax=Leptospirillum ferriphilum TaxID=178606 RepID=A0A1V3SYP7_9BACT|nr:alcohol dehydrogenase [Leptospirillum ferriphilum]OOH74285.1 alcohol dehydrogenase [Leptospirillum ferriphilum]
MKAVRSFAPGQPFVCQDVPDPRPGSGEVLLRVQACGICHSDMFVREGLFPGISYPRIPGHEVVGVILETGPGVVDFRKGDAVGVGWHGGHCLTCPACRRGDFILCSRGRITGISYDGGYAEFMVAPEHALARVPNGMDPAEAAPLLCAGVTTFNSLRHAGALAGSVVAVLGIGGLGHLALQFSKKMGFRTVALSSGSEKSGLARSLGADEYVDMKRENPVEVLGKMGGAQVILATVPHSDTISRLVDALGDNGRMVLLGADTAPVQVSPLQLIPKRKSVSGWPSGDALDSEQTLNFAHLAGIRAMVERMPLDRAEEAYGTMIRNKARFRVVLTV